MSRINTNVGSMIARRALTSNNNTLSTSMERLSTGLKINSGKDNPAGLIASESLKSEQVGITQAMDNAQRADNVISTAEGGLGEVSNLLNQLQSLVNQSANTGGLSQDETNANQLQVDSILSTINRIAGTTSFNGKKLLNGTLDYTTSGVGSGVNDLHVNAARLGSNSAVTVDVQVTAAASAAGVTFTGSTLSAATTVEIGGNAGVEQFAFAASASVSSMTAAINANSDVTGIVASATTGGFGLYSKDKGSDQFVSVRVVSGSFSTDKTRDTGTDAQVSVNGAKATTNGTEVSFRSSGLDVDFNLTDTSNAAGQTTSFSVTGGGATFSLGSKVTYGDQASIGIGSVTTGSLGSKDLGYLNSLASGFDNDLSSDNLVNAQKIVDSATSQVATLRGRLGAFQKYTIGATISNLGVALENVSASQSAITDTDFAEETANMTRSQILSQAAQSVLSQANSQPQSALRLLQ